MNLESRFAHVLDRQNFFRLKERVFVACSGGPDSTALYFLLKSALAGNKIKLGLLHFNHQLRGAASDGDEAFVRKLARKEGVPFISGKAAGKGRGKKSVEEAARHERYAFFEEAARRHSIRAIATAHTLDDQAETVLMRVLQGTGPQGLAGIRRILMVKKIRFIRPLLKFSKAEILAYLRKNGIAFCRDRSNRSPKFLRNRLRAGLLPQLEKEFNPRIKEALARIPAILEEENEMIEMLKARAAERCIRKKSPRAVELKRKTFQSLPSYLQFWVLDAGLKKLDPQSGMSFEAWQTVKPRLKDRRFRHSLPKSLDLELGPSVLVLRNRLPKPCRG